MRGYDFEVIHRKGNANKADDALSMHPLASNSLLL